ncbi:MAG: hypothetical protein E4H14_02745 [Candidatus Thorarchaeota archaeon]|nr:MAG: hypothetical protein E4H14_02745 [Candidatus Thorarchaeota archaeon]
MDTEFSVTFTKRNVNSKRILKLVENVIGEVCNEYILCRSTLIDKTYDYTELATFLEMFFYEMIEKGEITHFNIIADHRNNNPMNVRDGKIEVKMQFRQTHCLNVTEVIAHFQSV